MIKELRERHGVREIMIEDDTFVASRRRVREFCERLIAEKHDMSWSCLGRADRVTPDLLRLMRQAGCWHISYGIETGDPEMLARMGKNEDLAQIREALRWSREAGLRTKGFFMIGFPGETRDSLARTKKFALSLPLDDISVMQFTPFPGCSVYPGIDHYGTFDRDWRKMNILTTVFVPHGFTLEELDRARSRLLRSFYFRSGSIARKLVDIAIRPSLFPSLARSGLALASVVVSGPTEKRSRDEARTG
jgi:radical SAM superfamily enzyme YgiQ (UPF0313 family)